MKDLGWRLDSLLLEYTFWNNGCVIWLLGPSEELFMQIGPSNSLLVLGLDCNRSTTRMYVQPIECYLQATSYIGDNSWQRCLKQHGFKKRERAVMHISMNWAQNVILSKRYQTSQSLHILWFHVYKNLEKATLIYSERKHTEWWAGTLPWWLGGKESACRCRRHGFGPWVRKNPWRRKWQPTLVVLPGKSHGQRSLVGHRRWGHKELDTT